MASKVETEFAIAVCGLRANLIQMKCTLNEINETVAIFKSIIETIHAEPSKDEATT